MRVVFEEDNNEVMVEIKGMDTDFPIEDPDEDRMGRAQKRGRKKSESHNNNATVDHSVEPRAERETVASPRARNFREMVARASATSSADGEMETDGEENVSKGTPENMTERSQESDNESDQMSETSLVKIYQITDEERELQRQRDQAEFMEASEKIVDEAVNKTFSKLMQFMKDSGLVMQQVSQGLERERSLGSTQQAGEWKKPGPQSQQQGRVRGKSSHDSVINERSMGSTSETTVYEGVVKRANPPSLPQDGEMINNLADKEIILDINNTLIDGDNDKRISTSSEELGDTSGEMDEAIQQVDDLNLIAGPEQEYWRNRDRRDQYYDEPP